jgi:SAM-dependent methyltransferase
MSRSAGTKSAAGDAVIWHDVECAIYDADLPLWRELADDADGEVLDLGSGTGRVALDLAARGIDVTAVDSDAALLKALASRARERDLRVKTQTADMRSLALGKNFALAFAAMQSFQLLGGAPGRHKALASTREHLDPGALLAIALANPLEGAAPEVTLPPLPDVREEDGWVYSSTPVSVRGEADGMIVIERLRQAVSPTGELSEVAAEIRLDALTAEQLATEAEPHGFKARVPQTVPETDLHVGSTVVLLEAD